MDGNSGDAIEDNTTNTNTSTNLDTTRVGNDVGEGRPSFFSSVYQTLKTSGHQVLSAMEFIGENVAYVLGLDEPKFQYVIDGMTERDWEIAREVDRERRMQDQVMEQKEALESLNGQPAAEEQMNPVDSMVPPMVESNEVVSIVRSDDIELGVVN